jgi:hypothetical protein
MYTSPRPVYTRTTTTYVNRGPSIGTTIATSMATTLLIQQLSQNADEETRLNIATCQSMQSKEDVHSCLVNLKEKQDSSDEIGGIIVLIFLFFGIGFLIAVIL